MSLFGVQGLQKDSRRASRIVTGLSLHHRREYARARSSERVADGDLAVSRDGLIELATDMLAVVDDYLQS
ncbi:hypothetical protein [Antrihabitans stalactiti]|uniref:hypothetical protein n=1 Tax=Antrihabitans stalactiti TaxID=2584121 RepID=UPI001F10AEFD|nr:hypothetical protein [Antrihabitans stalactiti]